MDMLWWHWVVIGLILAGLELFGPGGFFIVFFGVGAIVVGLLSLVGFAGPLWVQWLLFSFFSVVSLSLFRNPLLRRIRTSPLAGGVVAEVPGARDVDPITGETAIPVEEIAPGGVGRAELRGSTWTARNVGPSALARGQRCRVVRVEGLMLAITAEGAR